MDRSRACNSKRYPAVSPQASIQMHHHNSPPILCRPLVLDRQFHTMLCQLPRVRGQPFVSTRDSQLLQRYEKFNTRIGYSWSAVSAQTWRYLADRTGVIAYANLPLIWMFSGRNNIFIWLTGWHFSTFNLFHKHIARIATLQAIFHSIGYTAFYFTGGFGMRYRFVV